MHANHFRDNVSVVVLNYNQAEMTLACLDALERARSELVREIIVVDNGSEPQEVDILRKRHVRNDFVLVEVGTNRFFGEGNNIGVDLAQGDYVVFLNNDAFVQPGWIDALSLTMRADPTVAAVGPMFLYPDGRVQEVGSIALPTGDVVQVGKGAVWGPDHYDRQCTVDFCSAACLLMRRADFLRVGGFGFEWEPAYYEDVDLCLKLWTQCGKVMVNPAARVVHIESKTTSDARLKLDTVSEINRVRFVAKWGHWLESRQTRHLDDVELPPRPGQREQPAPAVRLKPDLVLYSPFPLVPGGGERVMFELASYFSSLVGPTGVVFTTPHRYSAMRIHQISSAFGIDETFSTQTFDEADVDRCRCSVVLGNSIIPAMPAFGRRSVYWIQFPFCMPDEDVQHGAKLLNDYDEIWVYSEFVRHNVNGLLRHYGLASIPIRVVPPPATWSGADAGRPWADRSTIVSVGRFFTGGHNKRQDVVIEAFRRLVNGGLRGFELALAGSIQPGAQGNNRFHELQAMAAGLPCRFLPNVGRNDLAAVYRRSAVLIHAAGFGVDPDEFPERLEHFGITPVEAASFGCIPVVYGQGGPREVIRVLGCDTTFETVDECVDVVRRLIDDPRGSAQTSADVRQNSQAFSTGAFRGRVGEALQNLGAL